MTARHRINISDFVIIQTVPSYIITIHRGAAAYSKKTRRRRGYER